MSLLLDIIVIAAFALCLVTGIKRGFIRSIMGIVVMAVAIFGATKFSPPLAAYLNDTYIEKAVTNEVFEKLDEVIADVDSVDLSKLFEENPQVFSDILDTFGIDFEELKAYFENDLSGDNDSGEEVSGYIAEPLARMISNAAAFAVLFLGISLILSVAILILDLVVKLPILNGANKLLGGVFGGIMGLALAWGLSLVFCSLLPHLSIIYPDIFPASSIENTMLVKLLGSFDILALI